VPITGSSEPDGAVNEDKLMTESEPHHLRVLIANERAERLERVAVVVVSLGHTVIARELNVDEVGKVTREERPDVALVGLGESSKHALEHISQIVHEAACPVIALLGNDDPEFVSEAARRGVFGFITDGDGTHLQGAIDIALGRFAEYHNLEGAFGRRAVIERAKGILMERHGSNDKAAFEMLRDHSQHTGRKLFDIAQAILDSHQLLSPTRVETPTDGAQAG
jgi:AmiR/NasT family two-component response regulator